MRLMPGALNTSQSNTPIFLSSGAEDYFLSASYFDEGLFQVRSLPKISVCVTFHLLIMEKMVLYRRNRSISQVLNIVQGRG